MPVLENARHEKFAQEVAKGLPAGRAYEAAGYDAEGDTADQAASRLSRNVKVQARISELKAAGAQKAVKTIAVTIDSVTAELEEALDMARQQGQPNHMVLAAMSKAKLNGLIVDKAETTVTTKHEDRLERRRKAMMQAKQRQANDDARRPVH